MIEAGLPLVRGGLLVCVLLVLAVVDLRRRLLPNAIVVPAGLVGLLLSLTADPCRWWAYPVSAVAVGASLLALAIVFPGGMGMGDVKMGGMLGAFLGPHAFLAVFLGAALGTIVAGSLLVLGRIGRRTPLPFGTFMAVGGLLTLARGAEVLGWYAGLAIA